MLIVTNVMNHLKDFQMNYGENHVRIVTINQNIKYTFLKSITI